MRRIDPAFPDLLPLGHRLGGVPAVVDRVLLDPVSMRLVWHSVQRGANEDGSAVPRKPTRLLVHAGTAADRGAYLEALVEAGSGVVIVLDAPLAPVQLPRQHFEHQIVATVPWLPALWGGRALPDLHAWGQAGVDAGVLLALAPTPRSLDEVGEAVADARAAGATFVLPVPLSVPPEDRHRVYDLQAGENGDEALENLLFHSDLSQLTLELEREATRACLTEAMAEGLPGPATAGGVPSTFRCAASLLLWARRLDLLDGVGSLGWQLRRAARALLASGRDAGQLLTEDNLRVVPGFAPWVEAFARSLWAGAGEPFEEVLGRWVGE